MRVVVALVLFTGTASAERHVIQRGETLQHVADAHGCSIDALMRANELRTTLVKIGTVLDIPSCTLRARAQTRSKPVKARSRSLDDDERARAALAVIDGATWIASTGFAGPRSAAEGRRGESIESKPSSSKAIGLPWNGELQGGEQLPRGDGYVVRRPERAFGAAHVVDHLKHSIAEVRALYPDVHTLAIGDLSAERGGKIAAHRSHQSGLDVDVGFYFRRLPDGYPNRFAPADSTLDLEATWALLTAFARTTDLADGVDVMFLDYAVQKRLYSWAHDRGTPEADLEQLFQYPRGKDAQAGMIRHWPNHADHVHVRFKAR